MRASVVISAFVAVIVGFGGSVAIILAAAEAVNASVAETSSWVAMLCVAMMVTTGILSVWHRMPIVTAWSTPGAAIVAATTDVTLPEAVGAFFFAALLMVLTAVIGPLARLITKIPTGLASAMLAGVLFAFVVEVLGVAESDAALVLPLLVLFFVFRLFSGPWAVIITLAAGVGLSYILGMVGPTSPLSLSAFVWISPEFDLSILLGVGIPVYLVTMASQNLPGFAVLKASGYEPPTQSIMGVTGVVSFLTAGFGAHAVNSAAIIASICTGPDAHPDPAKRWLCGPFYALGYGILALFGASVVALFASFPQSFIITIAAVALFAPFVSAVAAAFEAPDDRITAAVTFVVTASGVSALGLGAAFWGLIAGILVMLIEKAYRRIRA